MPDLATLEALLAVARSGSLSKAAPELGTSQQAVSARITSLENSVGVRLTTRTPRGSVLTDHGRLLAEWADELLQHASKIDAGLNALRETARASIRLSASLTIAEQLLPAWLVGMNADARRRGAEPFKIVLIAANSTHVAERVRDGLADLGFVEGPTAPSGVRSRVIAHDELVLVVPNHHPWAKRHAGITIAELARTALVSREQGSGTRDFLDAAITASLESRHDAAGPAIELSTSAAVRAAVLAGAGPTVISRLTVNEDIVAGRLSVVPIIGLDTHRALRAIWMGNRTPPAGATRDMLAYISSTSRRTRSGRRAT